MPPSVRGPTRHDPNSATSHSDGRGGPRVGSAAGLGGGGPPPRPASPQPSVCPAGAAASSCKAAPPSFLLVPSKFPAATELERLCRHTGPWGPAGQWPRGASSSGRGLSPARARAVAVPRCLCSGARARSRAGSDLPGTSLWSGELPTHCVVRETGVELVLPSSGGSGKPCPAFGVCLYECHRGAAILAVSSAHTSTPSHTCCSDVRSHLFSPRLHPLWSSCWSHENRDLSGTADSTFGGVLNTTPPAAPTRPRGQVPQ